MFPVERQTQLDPVLAKLRDIPGLEQVDQDDFDSQAINAWLYLQPRDTRSLGSIFQFAISTKQLRVRLRRIFRELGIDYRVTDFPVMRTEYIAVHDRRPGDPSRRKLGYDQRRFGIEVFV